MLDSTTPAQRGTDRESESDESNGDSDTANLVRFPPRPVNIFQNESMERLVIRKTRFVDFVETNTLLPQNTYQYAPISEEEVRILILHPPEEAYGKQIHCTLKTVRFSKLAKSNYEALSYNWGNDPPIHPIYLKDANSAKRSGIARAPEGQRLKALAKQVIPKKFHVRANLLAALEQFRDPNKPLAFWIDAICINQKNGPEKSHQLSKMLDIYGRAFNVRIWIGEEDKKLRSNDAMEFVDKAVNLKLLDGLVTPDKPNSSYNIEAARSWVAFSALLKRAWFTRRWVVQEIASAKSATVQCGSVEKNWLDFADAIELFMTKLDRIRDLYDSSELWRVDPEALKHVESFGAKDMVAAANNIFRKTEDGEVVERLRSIETLVLGLLTFEASNPRDTIYALLGIANDGPEGIAPENATRLTLDYNKHPLEVYTDFVRYCIQTTHSLDIICRHWALPVSEDQVSILSDPVRTEVKKPVEIPIPSWIGLLKEHAFGPPSKYTGRLNADSLVGEPGRRIYNASRNKTVDFEFGEVETNTCPLTNSEYLTPPEDIPPPPDYVTATSSGSQRRESLAQRNGSSSSSNSQVRPNRFDGSLYIKGIILDEITWTSSRISEGTIPRECLTAGGWRWDGDLNEVPEKLWRTLIADRGPDGKNPPSWYRRACLYCLAKTSPNGDINTDKLIQDKSQPEILQVFLKRVQSVVWNRKFFSCDKRSPDPQEPDTRSYFGLGSQKAELGDLICILFGCSVPVVLREHRPAGSNLYYEFIGECYAHGAMEGEAMKGDRQEIRFPIR